MTNIIDINQRRAEREAEENPTTTGPCRCMNCKFEWIGMVPVGILNFECPKCATFHGVRKSMCEPDSDTIMLCSRCDNALFWLLPDGSTMCCECGDMPEYEPD